MNTKVSRTLRGLSYKGFFSHGGEIFIPIFQSRKGRIRDTLRHEYGHALLYYYPRIKTMKGFSSFGHTSDKNDYVSEYAMTSPEEDFCETFMKWIKNRGKIKENASDKLKKKWRFINAIRMRSGSS